MIIVKQKESLFQQNNSYWHKLGSFKNTTQLKCVAKNNHQTHENEIFRSWTKCLKNQPCDVIKMREMIGELGKKTPKKEMDSPLFL